MTAEKIKYENGNINTPDNPVILFIEGDGTGPDIWKAAKHVLDAAVEKTYNGKRRIQWMEVLAGEKAFKETGSWLPDDTLDRIKEYKIAIKGPLTYTCRRRNSKHKCNVEANSKALCMRKACQVH